MMDKPLDARAQQEAEYRQTLLFIDGTWSGASDDAFIPVGNPATGQALGSVSRATIKDLDRALAAAQAGFLQWRGVPAFERAQVLRRAAGILRERTDAIARLVTLEQGKPFNEARFEIILAAQVPDWLAGEAERLYAQVIPSRASNVFQLAIKAPIGPVAAFTPWNFPINQMVRKIAGALAAGCSIIVKGPEETPAGCAELVRAFADAGVPNGVVNLVFGIPVEVSEHLISSPVIRKVSFTGSTVVGKHLAALAGHHMKPVTMELGGHAPVLVFDNVDPEATASMIAAAKWRNAGQSCISPTRILVQDSIFEQFTAAFVQNAQAVRIGDGFAPQTDMGPLANNRRLQAMEALVDDAISRGGRVRAGGSRIGSEGHYFQPTVLTDVPVGARVMNEEPFGPLAVLTPFRDMDEAISEANRLPYALAAYAFTNSVEQSDRLTRNIEAGMIAVNHFTLGLAETPFGGIKDSGFGQEGGADAIEAYVQTRFITRAAAG